MRKTINEEKEKVFRPEPIKNRLTEMELIDMDNEIKKFYTTKKDISFPRNMTIDVFDDMKWLKDKGALTKDGAVKIQETGYCNNSPILYEQLMADLEQYYSWAGRKEFVERKKIEGLQELEKEMMIKNF